MQRIGAPASPAGVLEQPASISLRIFVGSDCQASGQTGSLYKQTVLVMKLHGALDRCHVPDRIRSLALNAFGNALDAEAFLVTLHLALAGRPPLEGSNVV